MTYRTAAVRKVRPVSDYAGVRVTGLLLIALIIVSAPGRPSVAQDTSRQPDTAPDDTLRSYDLEEIVITSGQERTISSSTLQRVTIADIARQNAPAIDQAVRQIPAAFVQTNSRGETLVYLRNTGERQVGVFFDGALLNVPWDNRVDLSLVPSSVVGGITGAKGVPSVVYGTMFLAVP